MKEAIKNCYYLLTMQQVVTNYVFLRDFFFECLEEENLLCGIGKL